MRISKGKFKIIYADPPWMYNARNNFKTKFGGGAFKQYPLMKTKEICDLPVNEIADENSILFLWATFPRLQEALDVIKAWGFKYKTVGFVWIKKNKIKKTNFFGIGYYTKSNAEICLIATKGKAPKVSNSVSQIIESAIEKHSKKPDEVRNKIIELCGKEKRIELFAREKAKGWSAWGNQI